MEGADFRLGPGLSMAPGMGDVTWPMWAEILQPDLILSLLG